MALTPPPSPNRTHPLLVRLVDDRLIMAIIFVNSLVLFIRAFPNLEQAYYQPLFALDYICTWVFFLEMLIKLRLYGWRGFWQNGWNRFDGTIVLLSLPALASPLMPMTDMAFVLVLRAGRILRFFRLLRFIPDTERIGRGIVRALRTSVGVILALFLYNFILGLCSHYLFGELSPQFFGDPLIAFYTVFKIFTIEGWYEIPDQIARAGGATIGMGARVYFMFVVLTGGVLGLSLANAIFVDEMAFDNNDEVKVLLREMREIICGGVPSAERLDELQAQISLLQERLDRQDLEGS